MPRWWVEAPRLRGDRPLSIHTGRYRTVGINEICVTGCNKVLVQLEEAVFGGDVSDELVEVGVREVFVEVEEYGVERP